MQDVESITLFSYPDEQVAAYCQLAIENIRADISDLKKRIINIGENLVKVKAMLGHGVFCDWLGFHFNMSVSTAENYMNAAIAVGRFPKLWDYELSVMYMFTDGMSPRARQAILDRGPMSVDEAKTLIQTARADEWYEEVKQVGEVDMGEAYHKAEWALGDPSLRERAQHFINQNAEVIAAYSDREPWEIKKEAGMSVEQRTGNSDRPIPASLFLHEGEENHRVCLWVDGHEPEVLAIMPRPTTAVGSSWQRVLIEVLRTDERLRVRTADDIVGEEL